jgi:hypothetical protein
MPDLRPRPEDYETDALDHPSAQPSWSFSPNHPAALAREILSRTFREIDQTRTYRKRAAAKLAHLVYELQCLQPAEISDVAEALGQSLNTTRSQLDQLRRLDLVVRTRFEQHALYCLNGHHHLLISEILRTLEYV